jgi:hypothetical protein
MKVSCVEFGERGRMKIRGRLVAIWRRYQGTLGKDLDGIGKK